jgi:carboxymethylenebutenolidase
MNRFTRREFIGVTTLAAGFAVATQPISAQVITTDAKGLEVGEVMIPTSDRQIPAYRAMPATGQKFPVVLVVQEIFGVHEHIQDVCRRLAKVGCLAIAPQLYFRQGDVSQLKDIEAIRTQVVSKVPDVQVMADLDATTAWAGQSGQGDANRIGITGFCWGGRIVWLYAAHNPKIKAGVAWYGSLTGQPSTLKPKNPVDVASQLTVPVLGLYGGKDNGIPVSSVETMRQGLKTGKSRSEIIIYPEAPHGFYADYRPSYRKIEAQDGWKRLQAWFKAHGV